MSQPFYQRLSDQGLLLRREQTHTLQVNVGLVCNQTCRHCHLEAGPNRHEQMDRATMREVVDYAQRGGFPTVDITGGAPELNPHLPELLEGMAAVAQRLMFRANLTALDRDDCRHLLERLRKHRVVIVASLPASNPSQADAQRGPGVFAKSLATLKRLNQMGYGQPDSGLELNLVSNPAGAFLPPNQEGARRKFQRDLQDKHGIVFNQLFTLTNVPLGRFRLWLEQTDNYQNYLSKLEQGFNPGAVDGVMCRYQVSVNWNGHLFDCDFNLAAGLPLGDRLSHVRDMAGPPEPGSTIAVSDHCYTCTAGAGFTCGGAIAT